MLVLGHKDKSIRKGSGTYSVEAILYTVLFLYYILFHTYLHEERTLRLLNFESSLFTMQGLY